jgi:hypothetical protein
VKQLKVKMEGMETSMKREPNIEDINENEEITTSEEEEEEKITEERLIMVFTKVGVRPKVEVPMYEANLDVEELIDWINALDKYFYYEGVYEGKKVNNAMTRLKGHTTLWWDELQDDKNRKGKSKMKYLDMMISNFKSKFMPKDYQLNLFRQL